MAQVTQSMLDAAYWIHKLALSPHPEGGYYRRIYVSPHQIDQNGLPQGYEGARPLLTAIYYLLPGTEFSALHRLKSDELWHFYGGSSLTLHVIDDQAQYREFKLGSDPELGQVFCALTQAGWWFGASVDDPNGYSLVGCCVSPGFNFTDFELGERAELLVYYPQHQRLIERLTR